MPIIHDTDLFEVESDDKNPNILYVRHKVDKKIEFTIWPDSRAQGGREALIVEPTTPSKMEIDANGEQPQIVVVSQ